MGYVIQLNYQLIVPPIPVKSLGSLVVVPEPSATPSGASGSISAGGTPKAASKSASLGGVNSLELFEPLELLPEEVPLPLLEEPVLGLEVLPPLD